MAKTERIYYGSISAKPGEKKIHYEPVLQMADGSDLHIPFCIMNGRYDGPKVVIGGCMHGDEYNGMIALVEAMRKINLEELHGSIIYMPVQNPIGFMVRSRLTLLSPSNTTDILNMAYSFPGNLRGDTTNRLTNWIFTEVVKAKPDLYLDMHTGALGNECALHTNLPSARINSEVVARSRELAAVFGLPLIIEPEPTDVGNYGQNGTCNTEMSRVGIPAFTAELGLGYSKIKESVDVGVRGIFNVLCYMKMLEGTPVLPKEKPIRLRAEVQYRANGSGITYFDVNVGQRVTKGMEMGRTISIFGETTEVIVTPEDGYIIQLRRMPTTYTGERIARIGLLYPDDAK